MSQIINPDLSGLDISLGLVPGAKGFGSLAERDGLNQKVQGVDLWRGTADELPTPPDSGEQMTLVSTDANDIDTTGTGARTVRVEYIDANGDEQEEIVALNGLTPVDMLATNIRFVNAIHTVTVGSNGVAVGDISIYKFGDANTVYNMIAAGGNMSVTTSRMVPAGKRFLLKRWTATSTTQNHQVTIRIRSTSRAGILYPGVFLFIDSATLEVNTYEHTFNYPVLIPALAIIKVSAWANQVGTDVSASFDGVLL